MANHHPTPEDLRDFMDDAERASWDAASEDERASLTDELTELWNSIPGPTEEDLTPQYMGSDTYQTYRSGGNREGIRSFFVRKWKKDRKAARAELEKRRAASAQPPDSSLQPLAGSDERWWGHFYISHLDQEERNRIKRGDFEPREIEMLAEGKSPWDWHKLFPAGLQPPADLPPLEEWIEKVKERFKPKAERIRKAAFDVARSEPSQASITQSAAPVGNDKREIVQSNDLQSLFKTDKEKDQPESNEGVDIAKYKADSERMQSEPLSQPAPAERFDDTHWFETFAGDARLWGVVALIALAIAFSRRSANSDSAVWFLLVIAGFLGVMIVNTHRSVRAGDHRAVWTFAASVFAIMFIVLGGWWLTAPASPAGTPLETPALKVSSPVVASPTPVQRPSIDFGTQATNTPPLTRFLNRVPFPEGVQRLDILMKTAGYEGPTEMEVLNIVCAEDNQAEVYLSTNPHPDPSNSQRLFPGDGFNFQRGENTKNVYIFSEKQGQINIEYKRR